MTSCAEDPKEALDEAKTPESPYVFPHKSGPNAGEPIQGIKNGFWWIQYSSITSAQTTGTGTAQASGLSEGISAIEGTWNSYDYTPDENTHECYWVHLLATFR